MIKGISTDPSKQVNKKDFITAYLQGDPNYNNLGSNNNNNNVINNNNNNSEGNLGAKLGNNTNNINNASNK